jgi:hypothetical protein
LRGLQYLVLGGFDTVNKQMRSILSRRPPFGHVDEPSAAVMYRPGESVTLVGWVLDGSPLANIDVEVDGVKRVSGLPRDQARPDVCAVYPGYVGCPTGSDPGAAGTVGFRAELTTANLDPCPHLIRVTATDTDGNRTNLGERIMMPL